jgi:hypothetical protein
MIYAGAKPTKANVGLLPALIVNAFPRGFDRPRQ